MKVKEFNQELKRVGIEKKHAEQAFAYILEHGEQGVHDVWYHENSPQEKATWFVCDDNKKRYYAKSTARLTYLFALKDKEKLEELPPFVEGRKSDFVQDIGWLNTNTLWSVLIINMDVARKSDDLDDTHEESDVEAKKIITIIKNLFKQFKQIILSGPPGTGKTYSAKEALPELLDVDKNTLSKLQGERWDIVQFHPSYNYEDFVRGVQVETNKEGQVVYKTLNKTFGAICARAAAVYESEESPKYVLIIDEINRANVSSVLGELIYALEYRDKEIKTPYEVNGSKGLTIPKNLYIIGTMNTADRTIGQIDYAVRRRFAFVPCTPDKSVITNEIARDFFDDVDNIFEHTSPDFDKKDVRIGHSYFLASDDKLFLNIIYQVIPMLREYVKDGVLTSEAENDIDAIEKSAEELLNSTSIPTFSSSLSSEISDGVIMRVFVRCFERRHKQGDLQPNEIVECYGDFGNYEPSTLKAQAYRINRIFNEERECDVLRKFSETNIVYDEKNLAKELLQKYCKDELKENGFECFYWENKDGTRCGINPISRTVLRVTRDYLHNVRPELLKDINELQEWFPDSRKNGKHYGIKLLSEVSDYRNKFCTQSGESFKLDNGDNVVVTSQYNNAGTPENWQEFKNKMAEYGYSINQCYIFSIGEGHWRGWQYCHKYGFISSGGSKAYRTVMSRFKKGDIIFSYLAGESSKKGVVCYGKVITDEAKLVSEFQTLNNGLLADCMLDGDQKYRDKFSDAITGNDGENKYPDMAIGIEWLHPELEEPFSFSPAPQGGSGGYMKRFSVNIIKTLQEKFNLGGKESDE